MNAKLVLILGIVLGVLAFALLSPSLPKTPLAPAARDEIVSSGHFVLERSGDRWLDESFTLFVTSGGSYLLVSQSTLTVSGTRIAVAEQTHYDGSFRPLAYQLAAETPTGTQIVSAQRDSGKLVMEVRVGAAKQSDAGAVADDLFLLDNNVIAHYAVLYEAIRSGEVGRDFVAAVPQALARIPARWEEPVAVRFRSGDRTYEGRKTALYVGDTAIDLVSYEGRLVGLVNRSQGTVAFDLALLPGGLEVEEAPAEASSVVEREVTFESGGVKLVGTLTVSRPQTPSSYAAVFVAGSGPVDRDGNAPGLPMDAYRQLAHTLAGAGIASLRYDKRGVGASEGNAPLSSRADLLADVRAAWAALAREPETSALPRVAIGHSEGVYLVAELAGGNDDVAGLVLLCGSSRSLAEVTRWQVETLLRRQGASEEQVQAALAQEDEFLSFVKASSGQWADYGVASLREAMPWLTDVAAAQLKASALSLAWLREHYNADPIAALARVACPVLILSGTKDAQVPPGDGEAMAEALRDAGNARVESLLLADLNHVLRRHPEETNLTYQHLDEPVDARVPSAITQWMQRELGG